MNQLLLRRSELISIAIALAMLLAIAIFSTLDWVGYRQNRSEVIASRQILDDTTALLLSITDAESAQRGYLLTGNERYLAPYNQALQTIPPALNRLDRESAGDGALHMQVVRLSALVDARLVQLKDAIELKRRGRSADVLALLESGRGEAMTESIRQSARLIRTELSDSVENRSVLVRGNSDRSHLIAIASSIVLLVLLALGAVNISTAAARREQLIATLEEERRAASEVRDLLKTTLFSIADAVLVTDSRGRITYLNRVAESLTGWRENEAAGKLAGEVFRIAGEAARGPVESPVDAILRGDKTATLADRTVLIGRDGAETPIDDKAAPISSPQGDFLGVVLVFRDITQRRAAERERDRLLAEAESARSHLHSLFQQAPASINIYRGPDHVFELVHPLATQFFNGRPVTGLSARGVHRESVVALLDAVYRTGETRNLNEVNLRPEGKAGPEDFYVNYLCCPWRDASGAVAGVMTLAVNVTEQVAIKRAMQATEERLRETAKLESLGVLAGGIAHDFNNLLVGIIGNASMALEILPAGSQAGSMIEGVVKAGERAAMLTRQMLAYSGKGRFVIEALDLSAVVTEMLPLLKSSIPRTITLETRLALNLPRLEGDPAQIQQVFMNLVINGAEACGQRLGTVAIATAVEEIHEHNAAASFGLPAPRPGTYVSLEVADSGEGMPEEIRTRIFDPFFTTKFTGRGLGLSAVLGIIRAHKGAIEVSSEPGSGSTFKVFFPATQRQEAPEPRKTVAGSFEGSGTVLLIDDEEMVRNMARSALQRYGYRVLEAENGKAAIDLLRARADVDLVILDLTMPVMSGAETLAEVRRIRPGMAIVLSSGFSETEAMLRFGDRGLAGFLQKPYTAAQLADTARRALAGTLRDAAEV